MNPIQPSFLHPLPREENMEHSRNLRTSVQSIFVEKLLCTSHHSLQVLVIKQRLSQMAPTWSSQSSGRQSQTCLWCIPLPSQPLPLSPSLSLPSSPPLSCSLPYPTLPYPILPFPPLTYPHQPPLFLPPTILSLTLPNPDPTLPYIFLFSFPLLPYPTLLYLKHGVLAKPLIEARPPAPRQFSSPYQAAG